MGGRQISLPACWGQSHVRNRPIKLHKSLNRLKKVSKAKMKECSPGHLPKCPQASQYTPLNTSLHLHSQLSLRELDVSGLGEREVKRGAMASFLRLRLYLKLSTLFCVSSNHEKWVSVLLPLGWQRKLKYRDVGQLAQSYTANQWRYWFQSPLVTEKPLAREIWLAVFKMLPLLRIITLSLCY